MRKAFLPILFLIIISAQCNAQDFNLGLGGGAVFINNPDYFTREINDGGMGLGSGYNIGARGKIKLPYSIISITAFYNYSYMSDRADLSLGFLEYQSSIVTGGLGTEISLLRGPVSPYVGADLFLTSITFDEVTNMGMPAIVRFSMADLNSMGLGLSAGTEIDIIPHLVLDMNLNYRFYNLFEKKENEKNFSGLGIIGYVLYHF